MAGIEGCEFCGASRSVDGVRWLWVLGFPCCGRVCADALAVRQSLNVPAVSPVEAKAEEIFLDLIAKAVAKDAEEFGELFAAPEAAQTPKDT